MLEGVTGFPQLTRLHWMVIADILKWSGMGQITEKILKKDHASMTLQYSAIKTPAPIEHHLATMQISSLNDGECLLKWTTEISPDIFADSIHQGMLISIEGIKSVI